MRSILAALFVGALLFSGCLGVGLLDPADIPVAPIPPVPDVLSPQMLKVRGLLQNTTCDPAASSSATTANLKLLSSFKLPGNLYTPAPVVGQIDTFRNRTAYGAVNGNFFAVVNTTDPTKPVMWIQPNVFLLAGGALLNDPRSLVPFTNVWDVQFSADGTNIIVAINNRLYAMDATSKFARYNFQGGFIDMPADYGGQAERLAMATIGGIEHIFVAPGPTGSGLFVARLTGTAAFAKLDGLGIVSGPGGTAATRLTIQPYDMDLQTEFINGGNHTIMYAANGEHGILVLDVTSPLKPELIANLGAPTGGPNNAPAYYSSIKVARVDGKRLVIANQIGAQSVLKVWDMTDFKTPKQLAAWTLDPQRGMQPQGEITVVNSTLFLTHQSQGLFGFNLSALLTTPKDGLKPILHFQPPASGSSWDVSVEDGLIQVSDASTNSLQILGYGCFPAGDKRLTSVG
jgi:hypothetical protein